MTRVYNKPLLLKMVLWLVIMAIVMKLTRGAAALIFPVVALVLLMRNKPAYLLALILAMISHQIGSNFFFPNTTVSMLSIRCTLLILSLLMAVKLFGHRVSPLVRPFGFIFIYILWEMIVSFRGFAPVVSYLKLILFSMIYLAFMAVTNSVVVSRRVDARVVRSIVLAFAAFFLVGSVLMIPFPAISVMSWGEYGNQIQVESLFKGLTSHSQALGPMVALFSAIIFSDLVFAVKKWDRLYMVILIAAPILIFKSGSRTAMGTFLGSLMVVGLFLMQAREVGGVWRSKIMSVGLMVVVFFLIGVVSIPHYREKVVRFIVKRGDAQSEVRAKDISAEGVISSRMGAMEVSLYNFRKKPLTGNGFQVSEEMMYRSNEGGGIKSYLSAPIEKGVWITAVLEEGGVPGLIFFAGFLLCAFCSLARQRAYSSASTLFAACLCNLGEFSFFSLTYVGGLVWALVFTAVVMDAQRLNEMRNERPWMPLPPNVRW